MPPTDSLVVAVTRAVERAETVSDVRDGACEAAVDAGYAFACFSGRDDVFVTASAADVDPPDASDAVPTYRAATSTSPGNESGAGARRLRHDQGTAARTGATTKHAPRLGQATLGRTDRLTPLATSRRMPTATNRRMRTVTRRRMRTATSRRTAAPRRPSNRRRHHR
ncbi:hypothetical protein [Halobacterium bonnevillei]|uniref:Uncharacterized protein n=1 Tax=Halobacterium bonnevillei TaxID=2692200 RepID=A0A6B0SDS0_9EURY|nr:hypothetical protein [Halobacterium bonnevillei]MXR19885.1 hypothetical protein [Halobacterium bonnevillei]